MEAVNILYFGKHQDILETVIRLINGRENWTGNGVSEIESAIGLIEKSTFDLILLGCGIPESEEQELRNYLNESHPELKVIQHYGGGSGLLFNEVLEALNNNKAII